MASKHSREEVARWLACAKKRNPSYFSAEALAEVGEHLAAAEAEVVRLRAEVAAAVVQLLADTSSREE